MQEVIKDYRDAVLNLTFDESELFVQFLDGFSPIEELKGLPPEAVEDMTERFTTLHQEERGNGTDGSEREACKYVQRIRGEFRTGEK